MAKRGPEHGGKGQESSYAESTAKRLAILEAEISASSIDEGKKDHLIAASTEIRKGLDSYDSAVNKKDFKNDIHTRIVSLDAEFESAKNSKRKNAEAKPFNFEEYKGKKDREEERDKLSKDLEEAKIYLISNGIFVVPNFGKYKKIKDELSVLSEIKDSAEYEAKHAELYASIAALLDLKPEEKKEVPAIAPKVGALVVEPEEDGTLLDKKSKLKKDKSEPKIKVDHRRKENRGDGQEKRVERHEFAIKRWKILQGVMDELLGKGSIDRDVFEDIEDSLAAAGKTNSEEEEFEDAMLNFERNFDSITNRIPNDVRKEYYSQLNGNDPIWKKEGARSKEKLAAVVPTPDTAPVKEKDKTLENAKKRWALLKSAIVDKMDDEDRGDFRENIENIEKVLVELEKNTDERDREDQIREFERNFGEIEIKGITRISKDDKRAYRAQKDSLSKSKEEDKESAVLDKKDDAIEGLRELSADEQKEREKTVKESREKWSVLESVAKEKMTKAEWADLSIYMDIVNSSLYQANITKFFQEYKTQMKRFDNIFSKLLVKVGAEISQEFENRLLTGATTPLENKDKKSAATVAAEESKTENKEAIQEEIKGFEEKVSLILDIINETDKNLLAKLSQEIGDIKHSIKLAKKNLDSDSISQIRRYLWRLLTKASEKSGKDLLLVFNERVGHKIKDSEDAVADVVADSNTLDNPTVTRVSAAEDVASPEQQIYLQSYERDFGILEKIVEKGASQDVKDGLKWRIDTVRTIIDKAKKEMSQHNKMDEVVLLNMQALVEDMYINDAKLHAEFLEKISPAVAEPVKSAAAPASAPEKKGFFARAKEKVAGFGKAIFNKEVGKTVVKAGYDTVTTLLGVKIVSDYVYGMVTGKGSLKEGKGDLAEYIRGKESSATAIESISRAYQDLLNSSEKSRKKEPLEKNEQISARIEMLRAKVEAANISADAKKQIVDRLWAIAIKHKTETEKSKKERDQEVQKLLESYIQGKVSGVKIAKDALNFGLTITGLSLLRGAAYMVGSVLEKFQQARKEETREIAGSLAEKKDAKSFAKNVIASTARETARSLTFRGAKEGSSGVTKTMDFVKALGAVARGVGIFNLTVLHGDTPKESIDNLIQAIKEGDASIISTSFQKNAGHVWDNMQNVATAVANPIETVERITGREQPIELRAENVRTPGSPEAEASIPADKTADDLIKNSAVEAAVPIVEAPEFNVQNFAAEHKLSQESLAPLQKLVEKYPSLKEESLTRILEASRVGDGVKFHHGDIVRGEVDNLIEAEGERRSVIFEELVKAKDYEAAGKYLEEQDFSSRHKSYLTNYIGKGTHEDYVKFAKAYGENPDKKMTYGLFRAMQGKGNTDLANAGLVRSATEDRSGRTISLQGGELKYFGLNEKGEPILSGQGRAVVKETVLVKITTTPTTIENAPANDGMSVDDKLWANANTINEIQGEGPYDGDFKNAPASELSEAERDVLAGVEADKAKFAKLGEEHIKVLDKPIGSGSEGFDKYAITRDEAGNETETLVEKGEDQNTPTEKTLVGRTIKTYTASGEVVQANGDVRVAEAKAVEVKNPELDKSAKTTPVVEEAAKKPAEVESSEQTTEAEKIENLKLLYKNYDSLGQYIAGRRMDFIFVGDGQDILTKQIRNEPTMTIFRDYVKKVIAGDAGNVDEKTVKGVERMKQILDDFNHIEINPDWYESLKGKELKLFLDPNKDNLPMLANDSHIVRIIDKEGKGILLSDSDDTFVVKEGKLLRMNKGNLIEEYSYEEAVKMAKSTK